MRTFMSLCWLVCRSAGWSVGLSQFPKRGWKLHFRASIRALVLFSLCPGCDSLNATVGQNTGGEDGQDKGHSRFPYSVYHWKGKRREREIDEKVC